MEIKENYDNRAFLSMDEQLDILEQFKNEYAPRKTLEMGIKLLDDGITLVTPVNDKNKNRILLDLEIRGVKNEAGKTIFRVDKDMSVSEIEKAIRNDFRFAPYKLNKASLRKREFCDILFYKGCLINIYCLYYDK